ncbi:unnamed protein product [Ectocarpus sp. CCAP 1310/34]|nr:unnamed protein product [Ectocarpus sp. CCAP 1310/34]
MQAAKSKHLPITAVIMFVVYSSGSFNIFQTFVCERLDTGVDYLGADYSLTCCTVVHKAMMVYAGPMIFVYPVGIPAFYAWVPKLDHLQSMRDLWAPYKPHRYYFEVVEVECGRRIVLTGLAAFLLPKSAAQVAIEVVLAAIFMAVSDVLPPFVDPFGAWLYRIGGWIIFFSMYLALLLKVDVSDEDNQSQAAFAKVLIAAHAGMVAVIVGQAVLSMRRSLIAARDKPVTNESLHRSNLAQACEWEGEGEEEEHAVVEKESNLQRQEEDGETGSGAAISA